MLDPVVRISLDQLRQVLDLLLKHVTKNSANEVVIAEDYFWSIPSPDLYDMGNEPRELTVGQVSEAWGHLQGMLEDESTALGYGLVWLGDVLRAVGHEPLG